jgi:hypothetical protein
VIVAIVLFRNASSDDFDMEGRNILFITDRRTRSVTAVSSVNSCWKVYEFGDAEQQAGTFFFLGT